jgi:hypothetical protein
MITTKYPDIEGRPVSVRSGAYYPVFGVVEKGPR